MKIIVGLGNPGKEYAQTRHNVGFMVLDRLVEMYNVQCTMYNFAFSYNKKLNAEICMGKDFILVKPQTFMNESGEAVVGVVGKMWGMRNVREKIKDLWVVHDEMDLELGRIKIHAGGSSGHHGVESIIKKLGSEDFYKFRLGVGRPSKDENACLYKENKDFLLSPFTKVEKPIVEKTIENAVMAIRTALNESIDKAASRYNKINSKS